MKNKKLKMQIFAILILIFLSINFSNIPISYGAPGDAIDQATGDSSKTKEELEKEEEEQKKNYPEYKYNRKNLPETKKELEKILEDCKKRKQTLQRDINLLPDTSQKKQSLKEDYNKVTQLMTLINSKIAEIEKQNNKKEPEEIEIEEDLGEPLKKFSAGDWVPNSTEDVKDATKLQKIGNIVIGAIRTIGSILSVIVLIIIGFKYIIGSVEEKAEYKKTMIPYVIGAVLVFGITNILAIAFSLINSINS